MSTNTAHDAEPTTDPEELPFTTPAVGRIYAPDDSGAYVED